MHRSGHGAFAIKKKALRRKRSEILENEINRDWEIPMVAYIQILDGEKVSLQIAQDSEDIINYLLPKNANRYSTNGEGVESSTL